MKVKLVLKVLVLGIKAYALRTVSALEDDLYESEKKQLAYANRSSPHDELYLEIEARRERRKRELLRLIRSAIGDAEGGADL